MSLPEYEVVSGPVVPGLNCTEALTLKVAMGMIARGEIPFPGMSMVCILALARLTNYQEDKNV